METPWSHYCSP